MITHVSPRRLTILAFTWAAGSVDAIIYIIAHVFTANMTGNAVLLGIAVGSERSAATLRSLVALITFTAGVVLGAMLAGQEGSHIPWKGIRIAAVTETMLLGAMAAILLAPLKLADEFTVEALIIVSAFAMGLQSATVRRLNLPGISTTYITGTMTNLISGLVHRWRPGAKEQGKAKAEYLAKTHSLERTLALQAWVFALYVVAALASAMLYKYWAPGVALLPFVAIAVGTISIYAQESDIEAARQREIPSSDRRAIG
jgi:uncharacterized membrane protein YoaK (UPF0700 family)